MVTYVEVVTKLLDRGASFEVAGRAIAELDLRMVVVTEGVARRAAELRNSTREHGLSLGDRICLATAEMLGVEASAPIILVR